MLSKPIQAYPNHPEFEELLNSCGSMTKQLEQLGHCLTVTLLAETENQYTFSRYVSLNLNTTPVVIASSQTTVTNQFFYRLLKNANTTPIGKFLFAKNSQVQRVNSKMKISRVVQQDLSEHLPLLQRLALQSYQSQQLLWARQSLFTYPGEELQLLEIILPELEQFF